MLKNANIEEIRIDFPHKMCYVRLECGEAAQRSIAGMPDVFLYIAQLLQEDGLILTEHTSVIMIH